MSAWDHLPAHLVRPAGARPALERSGGVPPIGEMRFGPRPRLSWRLRPAGDVAGGTELLLAVDGSPHVAALDRRALLGLLEDVTAALLRAERAGAP